LLDAGLAEVAAQFGLLPETHTVDAECCLLTKSGLAAVHPYIGDVTEIVWVGTCLSELAKRGIRGLGLLLQTNTGQYYAKTAQHQVFISDYIPGASCDSSNTFEVRAIGRLLAEVHRASEDILYFFAPPLSRVSPLWRLGAQERTAYWQLAALKYRQAARGEALRRLLTDAEESLNALEKLERAYDGTGVLSFAHLNFSKFVYVSEAHAVHLNHAYNCYVEPNYISLGEMLLDTDYVGEAGLHLLAAYQSVHPISDLEWQLLFAFLTFPHEWAQQLDDMTRGRPLLKGPATLEQLKRKHEWLEWLGENCSVLKRTEKGGQVVMSEEKRPTVATEEVEVESQNEAVETNEPCPEQAQVNEVPQVNEAPVESIEEIIEEPEVEKPKASIVWKAFPRPLNAKAEEPVVDDNEEVPT